MDKDHKDPDKIDLEASRLAHYIHKAWKKHQNTVYWVDINLAQKKGWSSIRHDRTRSSFMKRSQLIVSRKVLGWKLEKSYSKKYTCHLGLHQRSPWNTTGKENWVQKMLDDQKEKLLDKQKVPNWSNQLQTQIMMERGDPLFAVMQITSNQCSTRLTSTSEYPDCHILLWNKLRTLAFVNSWRRLRTTLTDNLFNEIQNKTKPTTHLVKCPRRWLRTWAM